MPNGEMAAGTIAVKEGRARRIADYNKHPQLPGGKYYPRESAKRHATLKSQMQDVNRGVRKRQRMAREGRMIHGSGGNFLKFHGNMPSRSGEVTKHWKSYKKPSGYAVKKANRGVSSRKKK